MRCVPESAPNLKITDGQATPVIFQMPGLKSLFWFQN